MLLGVRMKLLTALSGSFVAVCSSLAFLSSPSGGHALQSQREDLARVTVLAYGTNLKAFTYYRCRYRYTKAQAKSIEDAIAGKFVNTRSYENRLLVDGEKVLHEGLAPPEQPDPNQGVPIPGTSLKMVPAFAVSDRYLADGRREMSYTPQMKTLGLWDNSKAVLGIGRTPLGAVGYGNKVLGPETLLAQPEKFELAKVDLEDIEGVPVVVVRFDHKEAFQLKEQLKTSQTFYFDGGRGHIPVRIVVLYNDRPQTRTYVTEVRECSNQRWFPDRVVEVDTPAKADSLFNVSEFVVLELDADRRPKADEFAFTIPAGTVVNEGATGDATRYFVLKQEERIRVEDLPTLFAMLDKAQINPLMDTAVEVHRRSQWPRWLGVAAGLALALGGAAYLVRRRRQRAG